LVPFLERSTQRALQVREILRVPTLGVSDFRRPMLGAGGQSSGQNQRRLE